MLSLAVLHMVVLASNTALLVTCPMASSSLMLSCPIETEVRFQKWGYISALYMRSAESGSPVITMHAGPRGLRMFAPFELLAAVSGAEPPPCIVVRYNRFTGTIQISEEDGSLTVAKTDFLGSRRVLTAHGIEVGRITRAFFRSNWRIATSCGTASVRKEHREIGSTDERRSGKRVVFCTESEDHKPLSLDVRLMLVFASDIWCSALFDTSTSTG